MSKIYTITLSDAEDKALSVVTLDQNEWIQNVIHERCRVAMEEIISVEVQKKLSSGQSITGTKDDIVLEADIETAAEREVRFQEEIRKQLEEQQG